VVLCQSDFGGFQDTGQIIFKILKDHEDIFGERSVRSLLLGANNFLEDDHVGMFESLEEFHLAERRDWETVLLLFGVDALEGNNFVGSTVSSHKDASVGSLADLEFLFVGIDVSHDNGCLNRKGIAARCSACLLGEQTNAVGRRRGRDCRMIALVIFPAHAHPWWRRRGR